MGSGTCYAGVSGRANRRMISPGNVTLEPAPSRSDELLTGVLRGVSRSFYLTLRVLPKPIRPQISLAYLLARIADTIADTDLIASAQRLHALGRWNDAIAGRLGNADDLAALTENAGQSLESHLLGHASRALDLLHTLPEGDVKLIRRVLETIISGQKLDLERFQSSSAEAVMFLDSEQDLNDYLYRVAGCVGEFWTQLCFGCLRAAPKETPDHMLQLSIQFGKGLQLVNILRDLHADLEKGRCYLPQETMTRFGASIEHWEDPDENLQRMVNHFIQLARSYLDAGAVYTTQLPQSWKRVRLACAWPLMIGVETLNALPAEDPFNPAKRAKISRSRVRSIMARTVLYQPLPNRWKRLLMADSVHDLTDG